MEPIYQTLTPTLSGFIAAAKIHGLNPYTFLAKHKIDPKKASVNERNLQLTDLIGLLNSACEDLKTYAFVLTFVNKYEWYKFDAKVLALGEQDNLYTLTLIFNALLKEQGSGPELALERQGKIASYHIRLPTLPNIDNTTYRLAILATWDAVMAATLGKKWKPKNVLVSGECKHPYIDNIEINGAPVLFNKPKNTIEFDSSLLFQKLSLKVDKDAGMVKTYSEILNNITIDKLTESTIRMVIFSGDVSIEHVASILGTSPRVLQIKLKNLDTNFSAILNTCRISIAKDLLESTSYKVSEIACQLAFKSPEVFIRFFKKNEGVTPLRWRSNPKV